MTPTDDGACSTVSRLLFAAVRRLETAGIPPDEGRIEARLLLAHALGLSREELRLRPERQVSPGEAIRYETLVVRREKREPLAYIMGEREFYGLAFHVSPAVLIPRPETEFLVEAVLRQISGVANVRVADVGTGSGAIAVAVAVHEPDARLVATDISPDALVVAAGNACRHNVADQITFLPGDALEPLVPFAPFAVITSNPPYIAPAEIQTLAPEVRDWEPRIALGNNPDALAFYRRFAAGTPDLLAAGGLLAVEVGQGQAEAVADLWRRAGLMDVTVTNDYAGICRVVAGQRRA